MENEKMIAVLTELLEEQKEMNRAQAETITAIQHLKSKLDALEEAVKNQKAIIPPLDTKSFQQAMNVGVAEIKLWIQGLMEKPKLDNMRVFLESDAKKWAVFLLVALTFLTYLYCFMVRK